MYVEIQFFWDSVGSFPYMNVPVPTFSVFSVKASGFVQTQSLTNWYRNMHCTLTCGPVLYVMGLYTKYGVPLYIYTYICFCS